MNWKVESKECPINYEQRPLSVLWGRESGALGRIPMPGFRKMEASRVVPQLQEHGLELGRRQSPSPAIQNPNQISNLFIVGGSGAVDISVEKTEVRYTFIVIDVVMENDNENLVVPIVNPMFRLRLLPRPGC